MTCSSLLLVHRIDVPSVLTLFSQLVKLLLDLLLTLVLRCIKLLLALLAQLQLLQLVSHLRIHWALTLARKRSAELQCALTWVYRRRGRSNSWRHLRSRRRHALTHLSNRNHLVTKDRQHSLRAGATRQLTRTTHNRGLIRRQVSSRRRQAQCLTTTAGECRRSGWRHTSTSHRLGRRRQCLTIKQVCFFTVCNDRFGCFALLAENVCTSTDWATNTKASGKGVDQTLHALRRIPVDVRVCSKQQGFLTHFSTAFGDTTNQTTSRATFEYITSTTHTSSGSRGCTLGSDTAEDAGCQQELRQSFEGSVWNT